MTTAAPAGPLAIENPLKRLTPQQIEEIGAEFQKIHDDVYADLGEHDANYIRSIIEFHRRLAALSRIVLMASRYWPAWVLGTTGLSVAKILENMEIGHNVLHGQWDWMNDPNIHSSTWDWDTASPSAAWKHSHNYVHHTFTNIVGKDKDVGYEIMRVDPQQRWHPVYVLQPIYNVVLACFFEWGVAVHDLDFEAIRKGTKSKRQLRDELKAIGRKGRRQIVKDYIAFPALSGKEWRKTLVANLTANFVRNVWSYAIIFCGHFPDQAYTFTEEEVKDESRGAWYVRQQIAPRVKEICERYGLPYNTGPFRKQFGSVQRTILRLAFPGGRPRPKPGPFRGEPDTAAGNGHHPGQTVAGGVPAFP
jgi:fatty acid desaturase